MRESSNTQSKIRARAFLNIRLIENAKGVLPGRLDRIPLSELALLVFRDYRINRRKTLKDVQMRWSLHLRPFFENERCCSVTSEQGSTVCRAPSAGRRRNASDKSSACFVLKRMFRLGAFSAPALALRSPANTKPRENKCRQAFSMSRNIEN